MPIAGFTRLRKHQFGRQASFGTAIAATRAYPLDGTPSIELNWTDPDGDFGSIDNIAPPTRAAADLTAGLSSPKLYYNDIPLLMSGVFGGAVTPAGGGTSKTWTHEPSSLTVDAVDAFTYEFGDDVLDDWFALSDGIIESLTVTGPESMGALTADASWRFGTVRYEGATEAALQPSPTVPTAGLTVDSAATPVYLGNAQLFIDSGAANIGTTQIVDALHSFTLTVTQETDQKRFANGTGFDLAGYGRGARTIELECQFAKTDDTVGVGSESDAWFSETAINRFVQIEFTSLASTNAGTPAVPYSWTISMPLRYYTRSDGEIGQNSTVTLMGRAFYDTTTTYAFKSVLVNTLATAGL